jgi:hypothetical protein
MSAFRRSPVDTLASGQEGHGSLRQQGVREPDSTMAGRSDGRCLHGVQAGCTPCNPRCRPSPGRYHELHPKGGDTAVNELLTRLWRLGKPLQWRFL